MRYKKLTLPKSILTSHHEFDPRVCFLSGNAVLPPFKGGEGNIKRAKMHYVPAAGNECGHYELRTCINKNKIFKN